MSEASRADEANAALLVWRTLASYWPVSLVLLVASWFRGALGPATSFTAAAAWGLLLMLSLAAARRGPVPGLRVLVTVQWVLALVSGDALIQLISMVLLFACSSWSWTLAALGVFYVLRYFELYSGLSGAIEGWVTVPLASVWMGRGLRLAVLKRAQSDRLAVSLHQANEELRVRMQATDRLSAARERAALTLELNEMLGDKLALSLLRIERAHQQLDADAPDDARASISEAADETARVLAELRRNVTLLRDDSSDPLSRSLERFCRDARGTRTVDFTVQGDERRLPGPVQFVLFRVLGEVLAAVSQGAGAEGTEITLAYGESDVRLRARLRGPVFVQLSESGAVELRHRLASMHGTLCVEPERGHVEVVVGGAS